MDDVTASIIIACQTAGAVNSISKLGFALGMLGRKALEFGAESVQVFPTCKRRHRSSELCLPGSTKGRKQL